MRKYSLLVGRGPKIRNLYLGSHMVNDNNWCVADTARDESYYNVSFCLNLDIIVIKDIKAGEELYVDYNYGDDKKL